jgi:crotonobetainyl-CoA:carnitine CoA-transferase CaiB-like acyl-CoA transferase
VIDAASFIAGPVAATILADFGAEVVKIEPPEGDPYRRRSAGGIPDSPYPYHWIVDNRSKRGLALDLRQPAGREVLGWLVERADVFVTNTPLDPRERLRIRWEDLAGLNPRLVYASVTAYGEQGEEAARGGFDSTALWARTGLMDLTRPAPDSPPPRSLPGMGDHPTGVTLFGAIMAALYRRERTGRGTMVSTSLMANGLWWNAIQVQAALCGARVGPRPPREEAASALANLYRCRRAGAPGRGVSARRRRARNRRRARKQLTRPAPRSSI